MIAAGRMDSRPAAFPIMVMCVCGCVWVHVRAHVCARTGVLGSCGRSCVCARVCACLWMLQAWGDWCIPTLLTPELPAAHRNYNR